MRHIFSCLTALALLAACTSDPQTSGNAPREGVSAGEGTAAEEQPTATPVYQEDARTREILFRLKGPEEERPTNRR